jgi:hypothetical protein
MLRSGTTWPGSDLGCQFVQQAVRIVSEVRQHHHAEGGNARRLSREATWAPGIEELRQPDAAADHLVEDRVRICEDPPELDARYRFFG